MNVPEECDGYMCPECEPWGCSFPPGSKDLDGNVIPDLLFEKEEEPNGAR